MGDFHWVRSPRYHQLPNLNASGSEFEPRLDQLPQHLHSPRMNTFEESAHARSIILLQLEKY